MPDRYWNDALETLAPAELRRLEDERLVEQIAYDVRDQPVLPGPARRRRRPARRDPPRRGSRRASRSWRRRTSPIRRPTARCSASTSAPRSVRIVRIQATGGTTGQPMRIGLTRRDIADYGQMGARALWAMGCRPGRHRVRVHELQPVLGWPDRPPDLRDRSARRRSRSGSGHSERLLTMMAGLRDPVGIWATPSYAVRLAEVARRARDRAALGRAAPGLLLGRGRAAGPGLSRADRGHLGHGRARPVRDRRARPPFRANATSANGVHYGGTGIAITELIDPDSGEVLPFADGQQGEVVYTSIRREACPLLRMRSHDLMQVFTDPCPCGRTDLPLPHPRPLGRHVHRQGRQRLPAVHPGRADGLWRRGRPGEFQVVLDRPPPIDYPVPVAVEVARDVPGREPRGARPRGRHAAPGRAQLHARR